MTTMEVVMLGRGWCRDETVPFCADRGFAGDVFVTRGRGLCLEGSGVVVVVYNGV